MTHLNHRILILDFGSQYTQLIARRVRELGVYCEIHPFSMSEKNILDFSPAGIILSGGPETVTEQTTARAPEIIFNLACPVLGICYGMQTIALQLGGKVATGVKREFGYASVRLTHSSLLFDHIEDRVNEAGDGIIDVWMSHGDEVTQLPPGFTTIANTDNCPITAFEDQENKIFGLQFHPEVSHTKQGVRILERFILTICHCAPSWTSQHIISQQISKIREQVGQDRVILGLSGGVDSSVAALLLHQAIGDQLICIFVDTGLLRLHESKQVKDLFTKHLGIKIIYVDASDQFFTALTNVADPEQKRKVIGSTFIDVFAAEAKRLDDIKWLAQGTIYSDVIESAATSTGKKAQVIKSHHNVGGLPLDMKLKLIEPLRELFKDEVRKIGLELGLPDELLHRHPFPGPGLGVRILGEIKKEYIATLQLADAILIEELHQAKLYHQVGQAFVVFLPIKSVGVVGDARHYAHVLAIRIVETTDFMTAEWSRVPFEFLARVSSRIINEVPGVSRVTYDISSKPPATIEWE